MPQAVGKDNEQSVEIPRTIRAGPNERQGTISGNAFNRSKSRSLGQAPGDNIMISSFIAWYFIFKNVYLLLETGIFQFAARNDTYGTSHHLHGSM